MTVTKEVPTITIYEPYWTDEKWTIVGDLSRFGWGDTNYDVQDTVEITCLVDGLTFDSESGAFFAYADTQECGLGLVAHMKTMFKDLVVLNEKVKG
jgi:hypothetical protein